MGHPPTEAFVGTIVAMANQKGGVGKTTTAINLGASLAMLGKRALLVDADPQANSTTGVGIRLSETEPSTYECLFAQQSVSSCVRETAVPGLAILPAHPRLVGAEVELVTVRSREYRLKQAVASSAEDYDYTLIDCPPSLGLLTLNALVAAHAVLVPIQCEYYALEGLTGLLSTIKAVRRALNPRLTILGVLLTMYDRRVRLTTQIEEEIRGYFSSLVFATTIPRNVKLSEAPSFGKPIVLYDLLSKGAESYLSLAREVIARGEKGSRSGSQGSHP